MRGGVMRAVAVALLLVAGDAAAQPYRYVDEQGQVHYVARRDQVPERYRGQLGPAKPGEPAKPLLTPNPGGRAGATLPRSVSFRPSSSIGPLRSGPRKPIASSTRSTSSANSLPGTGLNSTRPPARTRSTFTPCSCLTRPWPSSVKRSVDTA